MSSSGQTRIQFEDPTTVLPLVQEVPNGSLILVRRSEYGCDVTVLPPLSATGSAKAGSPLDGQAVVDPASGLAIAAGTGGDTPKPVLPFTAEQIVDLMAEAVTILIEEVGRGRIVQSGSASPSIRLAKAAGVVPASFRIAGVHNTPGKGDRDR